MKWMKRTLALFVCAGMLSAPASALADDAQMQAELESLKNRLAELEARLATAPAVQTGGWGTTPHVESMVSGVTVSGFVDTTWNYNFNSPDTLTNRARVFDAAADTIDMSAAELVFYKAPTEQERVGFRTDLYFGTDSEVIGSAGLGTTDDEFDLEQAYVEMLVPTSNVIAGANDINLKVGKFVTLAGFEVIESKDNWNISRGLLFGYAIPFTHTGVRGTYVFDNGWDLALGVNNGWDIVDDTNTGKTMEFHFGFNALQLPGESTLTIGINHYWGPEAASNDNTNRNLTDVIFLYNTPIKPLTLAYNFDYGHEDNLIAENNDGNWMAHGVHAKWTFNDQWSLAGRYEFFDDTDGLRVISGSPAEYNSLTGTLEYRPWKNIITRLEYRYDDANRNLFNDRAGFSDNQSTMAGEVIYYF